MNKLIVKTVIITVVAFVGALALTFGALSIFCPVVLSDFFGSLGGNRAQAYFMEKEYQKSGEFDDLVKLVELLDEDKNPTDTAEYCELLLNANSSAFNDYAKKDGAVRYGSEKGAKEYFYTKYAVSELNTGDIENALFWAKKNLLASGSESLAPYEIFISKGASLGKTKLTQIKDNMNTEIKYLVTGQVKENLLEYIKLAEKIIGEIQ